MDTPPDNRNASGLTRYLGAMGLAVLLCAAVVLGIATPASADPAVPTNYRSEVLKVDPANEAAFAIRVVGGDSFLEIKAKPGHTVVVPDYGAEHSKDVGVYLEFLADGTVRQNQNSSAAVINESRYGTNAGTPKAGVSWKSVDHDGTFAWHDHRIHWMSKSTPPLVPGTRQVDLGAADGSGQWEVSLVVDGKPTIVRGRLMLLSAPSPVPWLALAVLAGVVALALSAMALRAGEQPPHRILAALMAMVAGLATVAGTAQWLDVPPMAGGTPITALVPAVGLLAALVAVAFERPPVRLAAMAAAAAALAGWALWRRETLFKAVLPTTLPNLDRIATAASLGLAVGVAAVIVWKPPIARSPSHDPGSPPTK